MMAIEQFQRFAKMLESGMWMFEEEEEEEGEGGNVQREAEVIYTNLRIVTLE